ncbi:MAG: hypothetical protein K0R75_994 [Paenibacillaceae bacterium]|nr:hypothetical protein [Paenibacillaceae bacterium]
MKKKLLRILTFCALTFALLLSTVQFGTHKAEAVTHNLTVHMVDVSGAGFIVRLPNGKVMVVDAGNDASAQTFYDKLASLGITKIDYLVGTHEHTDHIANFNNLIANYDVGVVEFPGGNAPCDSQDCINMQRQAASKGVTVKYVTRGDELFTPTTVADNGLSLSAHVYAPATTDDFNPPWSPGSWQYVNDLSLIFTIKYGDQGIMFTGDAGIEAQDLLMQRYPNTTNFTAVQVITAPHHGGSGTTSDDFLDYIAAPSRTFSKVLIPNQTNASNIVTFKNKLQTRGLTYWSAYANHTMYLANDGTHWWSSTAAEWQP